MIFPSHRYHSSSSGVSAKGDWTFTVFLCGGFGLLVVFAVYMFFASGNPDSWFCNYRIYKQKDGTYEVWWVCKSEHCEGKFATYEEAKRFQVKEVKELNDFMFQSHSGERVK